jgi:hypothetical protein
MKLSMHQAGSARFAAMLRNLSALLDKAEAHAAARKIDPAALTAFRLYPDMFPLTRQVQIACDVAKGAVGRLGGVEVPKHEDSEQTIAELKARIAKTITFIHTVPQAAIDAGADKNITVKLGKQEYSFTGMQYLLNFAHPNFYFHVTTAYNILRHNGVEVGKKDFNGSF